MTTEIRRVYVSLGAGKIVRRPISVAEKIWHLIESLLNLIRAGILGGPGVSFHFAAQMMAMRLFGSSASLSQIYGLLSAPMDTFRYFEFDFFWKILEKQANLGNYLDVSSPRLFNWRVLSSGKTKRAVFLNPDAQDLSATRQLLEAAGLTGRCELKGDLVGELIEMPESFDTVACISVLEHIPDEVAELALKKMWGLVKPGGRLLLSIPCAKDAYDEYIDFNEYGLLKTEDSGFVFGQRFYDQNLIEDKIFSIVGLPTQQAVFGERVSGTFVSDRERKFSDVRYPYWRESLMMAKEYSYFDSIERLPGMGVIAFEFKKI